MRLLFICPLQPLGYTRQVSTQFTASFNALPALKLGTLAAAICISAPVCGLRPVRAARSFTEKVPKPTRTTESPFFRAPVMLSTTASNARPAAALGISADAAMASISSVLFTLNPFRFICFRNTLAQANCYVGHLPCTTGAANELRFIPTDTIWVKETLLLYSTEQPNCLYFGQLGHSLSIHAGCSHAAASRMLPGETTVTATETFHQCVLIRLALSSF